MSVVTAKGNAISNRDSVPYIESNSSYGKGSSVEVYDYVSATNGDSAGSIYKLIQVPSNARLSSLKLSNAALGTGAAVNVGAYYPTALPQLPTLAGTVISAAFFASAQAVATANNNLDVKNQSGTFTLDLQFMPLWKALGLSFDPQCNIDICATVSTAMAATGLIGLQAGYAI